MSCQRRRFNLSDIPSGDNLNRVNRELDAISKGFPDYLLTVRDYMRCYDNKYAFDC